MNRLNIDSDYLQHFLKQLFAIPSPTGYTDPIVRFVTLELERLGLEVELTRRGAIRAVRHGSRRKGARAIVSHLDTLGAQVKFIKDNGRLALVPIGHWSSRFAEGARATVLSENGGYRGTILPLKASGHTYNDEIDKLPIGWDYVELRVDALARSREDIDKLGIEIGDMIAIDPQPEFLDNGFIVSRHLDNKAGVAVMLAAIKSVMCGQYYVSGEVAQKLMLANFRRGSEPTLLSTLTPREMQVMMMIIAGQTNQQISDALFLSPKTVSTYRHRLFEKLDVSNDVELTRFAMRHGLIDDAEPK